MVAKTLENLYSKVSDASDIREINQMIRSEMASVQAREELTELKKRSDYLCTLSFSPAWRRHFGAKIVEVLEVAIEENQKTVETANRIARDLGFDVVYHPWRGHRYYRSEERYAGGGIVRYLVYQSPRRQRNGGVLLRVRVKRLYFPADATDIRLEGPATFRKRSGREVYGVAVRYRYQLAPARVKRGDRTFNLSERWVEGSKVVELPAGATAVRLADKAPPGRKLAVA